MTVEEAITIGAISGVIGTAIWTAGKYSLIYLIRDYKKGAIERADFILRLQKPETLYRYALLNIVLMLLLFGVSGFLAFVINFVQMHSVVEFVVSCIVVVLSLIAIYCGSDCVRNIFASSKSR